MLSELMATSRRLGMGTRGQPLYAGEWKRSTHGLHLAANEGVAFNSSGQHEISSVVSNINEHGAELNELGRLVTMNTNHLVVQRLRGSPPRRTAGGAEYQNTRRHRRYFFCTPNFLF